MLKDLLNWDEIMIAPRYSGGHTEIMDVLFLNSTVIAKYVENDYQGKLGYIYQVDDKYVVVSDYFGSCSGCDSYEDASDEQLKNLCIQLANNAHSFDTIKDLVSFLKIEVKSDNGAYYDLYNLADPLLLELSKNRKFKIDGILED